ncbi:MAG: NAD(P)-dependent oxidoreductase, partial [Alphaproteobacteria bacterium]|nr:NAD(P)-dependent oxidoreductase [Alphaproteobacteria bacterium]
RPNSLRSERLDSDAGCDPGEKCGLGGGEADIADISTLGFVGLGAMGGPMCRNLVQRAGLPAIVHDTDLEARARCVLQGSVATDDPGRVARECNTVFLSLPGAAEVRRICLGENGLLEHARAGDTVVDCSTVPLALTRELAAVFADKGASYVDAPVAGTVQSVAERDISIMVGADERTFARLAPLLGCMAETVQHCGESGSGTVTKLLLNMVLAQSVTALAEALLLGRRAGVDGARLFEAFRNGCDSFALRQHGMTALLPGCFPEGRFPTRYMLKDLDYVMELKESLGMTLGGMDATHGLLERAAAAGLGDAYWPSLIEVIDGGKE